MALRGRGGEDGKGDEEGVVAEPRKPRVHMVLVPQLVHRLHVAAGQLPEEMSSFRSVLSRAVRDPTPLTINQEYPLYSSAKPFVDNSKLSGNSLGQGKQLPLLGCSMTT